MSTGIQVAILRGGTTYEFTDWIDWGLVGTFGFGMAPLHRLTERGPMQHGETDVGFRLDPATFGFTVGMKALSLSEQYTLRQTMLRAFAPTTAPLQVRVTLPDGELRQRDAYLIDGLSFESGNFSGFYGEIPVRLVAPDPVWYDPAGDAANFALGGSAGTGGVVPEPVPTFVGASVLNASTTVTYTGTWLEYPRITITGPITDAVITNNTTGDKLDFTGTTIDAGDTYTIDLRYGYKTVTDSSDANVVGDLTSDSDLATWHLAPDSEAAGGVNSITVTGTSATTATAVTLTWLARYLGI
jgi:hypothetical protein